ncbi:MAG: DUF4093 domain-containing protein [Oscillospiraceae bacterium]|jgi:ribonuclease M5|nr:DUF4093 domain-containing protein [Oscillospiraceae bacterium]
MRKIKEVIVVEGRYDKNTLKQVVDATVIETHGFGVFNDRERLALLRRLAAERGLILLTDSDGAGFVIRNFLKGAIPKNQLKQAYIPDIPGKERRKAVPGREGKLGVEGMPPSVLLDALERAGATFEDAGASSAHEERMTKAGFYALGLSGGPDSGARRAALLKQLGLPERMTANALLEAVNLLYSKEDFLKEFFSFDG